MKLLNLSKIKRFAAVVGSLTTAVFLFFQPVAACSWDYLIWQNRDKNADPYYRFVKDKKVGYIDQKGKIVIQPTLHLYGNYQDGVIGGLLARSYDEFVDLKSGEEVSSEVFYRRKELSDGLISQVFENKFGFIDLDGKQIIKPQFAFAKNFSEGFAPVVVEGLCSYYDAESPCPGDSSYPLGSKNSSAESCKFNFIDKKGKLISAQTYLDIKDFAGGLAPVRTPEGWGYIDRTGKIVIAPQFEKAYSFSDGLALVKVGDLYGYIDASGAFVIKPQFKNAESFANGLAPVGDYGDKKTENEFYYINKTGKPATKDKYLLASHYFKGLAHVLLSFEMRIEKKGDEEEEIGKSTYAYIDEKGKKVFVYSFEDKY